MIPKHHWWFAILSLVLCVLPVSGGEQAAKAPAPAVQGGQSPVIIAKRVVGAVLAVNKKTAEQRVLANESRVSDADIVRTADDGKSSVVLVFSNGTTVQLKHGSELDIEAFQQEPWTGTVDFSKLEAEPSSSTTKLNLVKGELIGKVPKLKKGGGSTMQVRTPVGVAGIRGTTFRVLFRPDPSKPGKFIFELNTAEGSVVFQGSSANAVPITVESNQEISVQVEMRVDPATGTPVPGAVLVLPEAASTMSPAVMEVIQEATIQVMEVLKNVILVPTPAAETKESVQKPEAQEAQPVQQTQEKGETSLTQGAQDATTQEPAGKTPETSEKQGVQDMPAAEQTGNQKDTTTATTEVPIAQGEAAKTETPLTQDTQEPAGQTPTVKENTEPATQAVAQEPAKTETSTETTAPVSAPPVQKTVLPQAAPQVPKAPPRVTSGEGQ